MKKVVVAFNPMKPSYLSIPSLVEGVLDLGYCYVDGPAEEGFPFEYAKVYPMTVKNVSKVPIESSYS